MEPNYCLNYVSNRSTTTTPAVPARTLPTSSGAVVTVKCLCPKCRDGEPTPGAEA